MNRTTTTLTALAALAVLVGCSSAEPEAADPPQSQSTPEPKAKEKPEPEDDCLDVPMDLLRGIAGGADNAKITPVAGAAVKSDDYGKVFMIAMSFDGLGSQEEGVWASNSLKSGGGLIMSVDGIAQEFTVWPNGTADSPMSITDHGAEEALDCL